MNGWRGENDKFVKIEKIIEKPIEYTKNWFVQLDLKIAWTTF